VAIDNYGTVAPGLMSWPVKSAYSPTKVVGVDRAHHQGGNMTQQELESALYHNLWYSHYHKLDFEAALEWARKQVEYERMTHEQRKKAVV
jgi:hypothetical protein